VAAIKAKKFTDVQDCFTPEGYDMYQKLINYGQASLVGSPTFSFYPMQDKTICRGIPMKFSFKNNNRTFIETVTFTFNEDKKIESMAFALDKEARNDIFNKGNRNATLLNKDVTVYRCNTNNNRTFMLTLQYSFNSTRDRYRGQGAGTNEMNRF
jgi:hypothetical protein